MGSCEIQDLEIRDALKKILYLVGGDVDGDVLMINRSRFYINIQRDIVMEVSDDGR